MIHQLPDPYTEALKSALETVIHEIKWIHKWNEINQGKSMQSQILQPRTTWSTCTNIWRGLMVWKNKGNIPPKAAARPSVLTDLSELLDTRADQLKDSLQARLWGPYTTHGMNQPWRVCSWNTDTGKVTSPRKLETKLEAAWRSICFNPTAHWPAQLLDYSDYCCRISI